MAKILLNVELETKTYEAQLKTIKEQLDKTFSDSENSNGGIGGVKSAKAQVESLTKSIANLLNTVKGSESKYAKGTFDGIKEKLTNCLSSAMDLNEEFKNGGQITEEQIKIYNELKDKLSETASEFAVIRVQSEKLEKQNKLAIPNVDNLRKKYANLLNTIKNQEQYYKKGTFSSLITDIEKNLDALKQLDPTTEDYAETVNNLDKELNRLSADFAETKSSAKNFHGSLSEIIKGFVKFQASAMLVMKPLQLIRQAWTDINETLVETETRVIELQRVAGKVANSDELYALAQQYGQTFDNVSEITLNFARNGMDWAESLNATEAALLAINVAELDATQASEGMIAIMNQFGLAASDLESVVDKLNITADNAAVSTEKLLTALQRTGSSAKNANLTLEETVGIVTALSEATGRSGENLGTAVNSLIQFSTKSTALDTFAELGGSVEKAVENYRMGAGTVLDIWRELSTVVKNSSASSEGILSGLFGDDDWRSLNEELQTELGDNFATVTEIYDTASTFRKNYFIALLQNLDQVQETLDTMEDSNGYSQKENLQYLDTYEAKLNKLQSKWQEIVNDEQGLLGVKKAFVDMASGLLDIFEKLGGIKTVLVEIAVIVGTIVISTKYTAILSFLAKLKTSLGEFTVYAIPNAISAWKAYAAGIVSANTAIQASIPLIGLATLAITASISVIKNAIVAKDQERELAVSTWEANKENAQALDELYAKYKKLTPADDEFLTVQKDLVTALGDKATALKGLKEDSEEYTQSVKDMTEAEIELYKTQQRTAAKKTEKENNKIKVLSLKNNIGIRELLLDAGVIDEAQFQSGWLARGTSTEVYEVVSNALNALNEKYNELVQQDEFEAADSIKNTSGYEQIVEWEEEYKEKVDKFLQTNTAKLLSDYEINIGKKVETKSEYDEALKFIIDRLDAGDFYDETIKSFLNSFVNIEGTSSSNNGTSSSNKTNLSDVVNKLEEIRENTEKTKELEEKQLALEEAKNQRTVRVFNAETGQWEMQANEKDIAEAEEDLKDTALDVIQEFFSTEEAQKRLDNGEFTLPEWLAEMLAQPTSDDKFQAAMKAMGIMSGAVDKTPSTSGIIYNNSKSNTTNNNQSYSLNGIPILEKDARRYFTPEAFELLNQIGN